MSSGDVKGWIDDLMAGDAGSALSESHSSADHLQPVLAHHSRRSQHRPAQSRKPDWREQPQAHAQDQEEDTVQPFSVEDADLSRVESLEELEKEKKLELERESAKRPLLRSGILSIVDSPIPLSMQLGKVLSAPEDIKDIQLKGCTVCACLPSSPLFLSQILLAPSFSPPPSRIISLVASHLHFLLLHQLTRAALLLCRLVTKICRPS